jgi:hypothetical protein
MLHVGALVRAIVMARLLAVAVFALLLLAARIHFALCSVQHSGVMLGMLMKVFSRHAVITQLRIACQLVVFIDYLLRRAAHFSLGTRAVENPVNYVSHGTIAVIFRPRT